MSISPARAAAFEILLRIDKTDAYASELLHSSRFAKLSPADHGLLTELVMGVLRWRSVLDSSITEHAAQALAKLDLEVLTALRLGAYQLFFLDRIPKHAAVNESVELVKQARKRSAAGMVNAVLRKIAKSDSELSHFSQNQAEVGLQTKFYEASVSAHPQWLVERWNRFYGADIAKKICSYDQLAPKAMLRISNPELLEALQTEGVALKPGNFLAKAFVIQAGEITHTKAFRERRLTIQDEASQLVGLLVGNGQSILDCCAAPGGKTRILAEQNPNSTVVAVDLHPHRSALLRKLLAAKNVRVVTGDARQIPLGRHFDRVLVDAPCSGTGTLARNPEIKWRLKLEDITRLQALQTEILLSAMKQVATGGRLIYSTCSLEPEENSEIVARVLATNSSFTLVDSRTELERLRRDGELVIENLDSMQDGPYLRTIPAVHSCDGFFAAILEKQ
ncbi:MAG TPA: 16S rRNA (cytosine(967)-C(5))-methyltransferase RsmB [Terriglobales bacterium]|nr:16S rRNA (cytosine(967)-C(5))-methyltransferase RsmB [Terriglobales bacterium]